MSFKALNQNYSTVYTLDEWERNLIHVTPYCPVCGVVTEKAAGSTLRKTHFAHSIQNTDCPTINDNRRKYLLLSPVGLDTENGRDLINWTKLTCGTCIRNVRKFSKDVLSFKSFRIC
ncbi:hypothetical protein FC756_24565 [Lysinibacillus mangiferihumi]|uniref:Uncharacterized protein n=1 Tax=Lysinibacillus mangiferihumi TaxID=1130819 RepID=A0A4U2Y2I6_9BACI|nr:hypothetical protein [Lysinibacillus mangiferihumi]TKI53331.1 hypothetical protein FC756_24565 [Lysinibacillus mangiferihumi]